MFLKNLAKLFSGNVIGQLIAIISIPIITRLYTVDAYGVYAVFLALVVIMSATSSLGLHLAILIPKNASEAKSVFRLAISIHILFCLFVTSVLVLFNQSISNILGLSSVGNMIFTIPLLVFLQGLYLILTYYCVREKKFGRVGLSRVIEATVDRGSAIGATFIWPASAFLLVVSRALSNAVSTIYLLHALISNRSSREKEAVHYRLLLTKYRGYIVYNAPSILLINATVQLPTVIIGAMYATNLAGLYALAYRLVSVPVTAMGGALSQLYTQRIAKASANQSMQSVENDTGILFVGLFSVLLIPFCLLVVIGEDLFSFFLGPDWEDAGVYAQYLSLFVMTNLLVQTFGGLFDVLNRQRIRLIFHSFSFMARIGIVLILAVLEFDLKDVVKGYSMVAMVMNLVALQILFKLIHLPTLLPKTIIKNSLYALVFFGFTLLVLPSLTIGSPILRIAAVSCCSVVWFCLIVGANKDLRSRVSKLLPKANC
jgi:lipopolysaccharide exporter